MGTLEKILNLIQMKNNPKSYSVKFYAEMKLDDGRVIATEDEQFMIGSKVFAISDDGDAESLSAGSYTMENGNKLTIGEDSEILDLGEEKEAEDVEAEKEDKEEMAEDDEADVEDWAGMEKRIKNLEDAVADLKADKESLSVETEEVIEEDEKVEMSKDMVNSLVEEVEELKAKIVELEKEPGTEGFNHNPENDTKSEKADLGKMSINDRVKYLINN